MSQGKSDKSDFFERVYRVAERIPEGRVTSYGAIAKAIGAPRSARMVGYAMNASINRPEVPAHRVVNRIGMLTGKHYFQGSKLMQQLLENEGVRVENDCVVNFDQHYWDPIQELGLDFTTDTAD